MSPPIRQCLNEEFKPQQPELPVTFNQKTEIHNIVFQILLNISVYNSVFRFKALASVKHSFAHNLPEPALCLLTLVSVCKMSVLYHIKGIQKNISAGIVKHALYLLFKRWEYRIPHKSIEPCQYKCPQNYR